MAKDLVKKKCICCGGTGYVLGKRRGSVNEEQKKKIIQLYKKGKGIREIQRDSQRMEKLAIQESHD